MPVAVRDLLAEETLSLRLCAGASGLDRFVRWVAVTELSDPTPWMEGGELVLTTGLRLRGSREQAAFVGRLAAVGASGLGFGTGLSHASVPRAMVAAADREGLPLLDVPYETPFIALNRLVAESLAAEGHSAQRRLVDSYDRIARALLSGEGLAGLVAALHRAAHADVAVVDVHGRVLASSPGARPDLSQGVRPDLSPGVRPDLSQGVRPDLSPGVRPDPSPGARPDFAQGVRPGSSPAEVALPVEVDGEVVAHLYAAGAAGPDVLPFAVRLVGLELARARSVLEGRRELAGQVLDDVVRDLVGPEVAERRLAAYGLNLRLPHSVVLGRLDARPDPAGGDVRRLRRLPWIAPERGADAEPVLTAVVGRCLVAVAPEGEAASVAEHLAATLRAASVEASVGVGGTYAGVDGLRWSYFEAQAALARGPGVHGAEPLNLPRLLVSATDLPLRRLGAQVLEPLTRFDTDHGGDLVTTLYTYLAEDCSVQAAADRLYVHRNTIRYRLDQIEKLTDRSLHTTQDRVQLWLALLASHLAPAPES